VQEFAFAETIALMLQNATSGEGNILMSTLKDDPASVLRNLL